MTLLPTLFFGQFEDLLHRLVIGAVSVVSEALASYTCLAGTLLAPGDINVDVLWHDERAAVLVRTVDAVHSCKLHGLLIEQCSKIRRQERSRFLDRQLLFAASRWEKLLVARRSLE